MGSRAVKSYSLTNLLKWPFHRRHHQHHRHHLRHRTTTWPLLLSAFHFHPRELTHLLFSSWFERPNHWRSGSPGYRTLLGRHWSVRRFFSPILQCAAHTTCLKQKQRSSHVNHWLSWLEISNILKRFSLNKQARLEITSNDMIVSVFKIADIISNIFSALRDLRNNDRMRNDEC